MRNERILLASVLLGLITMAIPAEAKKEGSLSLTPIGRYDAGASTGPDADDEPRTEIASFDPASKRLFSVNLNQRQLDVLDLSSPHHAWETAPI